MSEESTKNLHSSDISFAPKLIDVYAFKKVESVNLYISYELDTQSRYLNTDFTLGNCLFGAVKLTKNNDPGKYRYSLFSIRFNARS